MEKDKELDLSSEKKTIIVEEKLPLFSKTNPNHDIFVVPTQEGSDKEDQWNGSIGDATMDHIHQMRHKLLELENFVHMPNGNIFRIEHNVAPPDEHGERKSKNNILTLLTTPEVEGKFTEQDRENCIKFEEEEVAASKKAKEEKEDALDQPRVPFSDWEDLPQLTSAIDIPSTPTPLYIYAGNSTQMFYDSIPEDHPDIKTINSFISTVNSIDWDNFTEMTTEYFQNWIYGKSWDQYYAAERLAKFCLDVELSTVKTPTELMIEALHDIERDWAKVVKDRVLQSFYEDPVYQELQTLSARLQENLTTGKHSWSEIGKFGQFLYKKYGGQVTTAHWNVYKSIKKTYAPVLVVEKVDINRASINELRDIFKKKYKSEIEKLLDNDDSETIFSRKLEAIRNKVENLAKQIFFNRPFSSLEEVAKKGIITVEDIGFTSNTVIPISLIKKAYRESNNFKNPNILSKVANQIVNLQKKTPQMCSEQEWSQIWQCYRIARSVVTEKFGVL